MKKSIFGIDQILSWVQLEISYLYSYDKLEIGFLNKCSVLF